MLPSTLLEIATLRSNALTPQTCRLSRLPAYVSKSFSTRTAVRQAAMASLAHNPVSQVIENPGLPVQSTRSAFRRGGSLTPRTGKPNTEVGEELERRVKALESAAEVESLSFTPPTYTEEDLLALYQDLLALPPELSKTEVAETAPLNEEDILRADEQALLSLERRLLESLEAQPSTSDFVNADSDSNHARVLSYIGKLASRQEVVERTGQDEPATSISMPEVSLAEYESIGRLCVAANDYRMAELNLKLTKLSGLDVTEGMLNPVLKNLASSGNIAAFEGVLTNYLTDVPTERQRHYHIKVHLNSALPNAIPSSALDLVHAYESQNLAPQMQTYTSVITSLFSTNLSLGRAQAWDLFSHMRYVAHPNPDTHLYTLMIRACASPFNVRSSEPERALDLWTEMTVDHKLAPTAGAYDAIILACARSGKKMYVGEAFRLARQMLDSHRDAQGMSAFAPSRRTFCALLEGAKRVGDLGKARWILAQMASERRLADGRIDPQGINEEVMMHMFHSYASYDPPMRRSALRLSRMGASASQAPSAAVEGEVSSTNANTGENIVKTSPEKAAFTPVPPQSPEEVLREAQTLFDRILQDNGLAGPHESIESDGLPSRRLFQDVTLTPRLLNSFLSVFYKHAPLSQSRDLYRTLFERCNVPRTGRTFTEALDRCANSRRGEERGVALEFAEEVWAEWKSLEESGLDNGRPLSARTVEKAHISIIRVYALTENLDQALHHVREFALKYPASSVRTPSPKTHLRSTRTSLEASRPLVRVTSNVEVPDDYVPPLLMFDDLQLLHHRLLAEGKSKEIDYITYLCKSYEWALRVRRDAAMKQRPVKTTEISTPSDVEA